VILCSNLDNILEKGKGDVQASFGPLISGIGSQFTDLAGVQKVQELWSSIQVRHLSF
jgi:hypothetical protein